MLKILTRIWQTFDDRAGLTKLFGPIFSHPAPPNTGWWYVFGSATLFAFILQVVTGIALALLYVPSSGEAYNSLQYITNQATLGATLRGIHFFGASAMILMVGMHMLRTFITGAYKFPRELNWLAGLLLLLLTITMGFTGQILRWDQNAVWTTIVGADQAARLPVVGGFLANFLMSGTTINGQTLTHMFAYHVFFIPALIFGVVGLHLYLVLHHGISEPPEAGRPVDPKTYRAWYENLLKEKGVPFFPDAAWKDVVFAVAMIVVIVILAIVVGAPKLVGPPDPSSIDVVPRPDWYLLWLFAVMALIPPATENYFIFIAPAVIAVVLFLVPFIGNKGERSPLRRPWGIAIAGGVVVMIAALTIAGINSNWSPDFAAQPLPASVVGATTGQIADGATLFHDKGCEYCHSISGYGGKRGPDLTTIGTQLTDYNITLRILNGGVNMPAFANILTPSEMDALVAFLSSRK